MIANNYTSGALGQKIGAKPAGFSLSDVAAIGRHMLAQPTLEAGLTSLFGRLAGLLSAETLMVALYDRRRNTLSFPLVFNYGQYLRPSARPFTPGGLAEWVIQNNKAIISGNLAVDAARNNWQLPDSSANSAIMVPLAIGGQAFGVLAAQSQRRAAFSADAATLFTAIADTTASYIAHWQQLQQREWEEALLNDFDKQLAGASDPAQVLQKSATVAVQLTAADGATVVTGGKQAAQYAGQQTSPAFRSWMAQVGNAGPDFFASRSAASPGSLVAQPISRSVGPNAAPDAMLFVGDAEKRPFDEHDRQLLETVSRRAADALTRVDLGAGREQERFVIRRIARRCAVERDINLLLSASLNELRKLVAWDAAAVWHFDAANNGLRPLKLEGEQSDADYSAVLPLGQGPVGRAAQTGKVQRENSGLATIAVPLWGREGRPAALLLQRQSGDFSADEEKALAVIAELLAAGIDKSWWHEAGELARKLGTLLTTPGQDTWADALATIRDCMPEGACALLVANDDAPGLRVLAILGASELTASTDWLTSSQGVLRGLSANRALLVEDASKNAVDLSASGAGSLVAAPFTSAGQVFGALVAWSPRAHRMGERELSLIRRGAEHIAVALFASRETQRADNSLRLLSVMRDLNGQGDFGLDVAGSLKKVLAHAIQNTSAASGSVLLREGDNMIQRAQLPEGSPERALRVPLGQGAVGQVAQTGQAIYLANIGQSAGIGGDHGSLVVVPVVSAGAVMGVITVSAPNSNAFDERDLEVLRVLAGQASALLDGTNRQDALKQLRQLPRMSVSPAKLLAQVPVLISETLHAPAAAVHVLDRRTNTYVLAGAAGVDAASRNGGLREIPGELPSVKEMFAREANGGGTQQVVTTAPYSAANFWHAAESRAAGFNTALSSPIILGGLPYGILTVYAADGRTFSQSEASVLSALCDQLSQTLQLLHQEYRYGTLADLGETIKPRLNADAEFQARALHGEPGPTLEALVRHAADLADARVAYVLLKNDAANRFEPRVIVGGAQPEALYWPLDGAGSREPGAGTSGTSGQWSVVSGQNGASNTGASNLRILGSPATGNRQPATDNSFQLPAPGSRFPVADPTTVSQVVVPLLVAGADGSEQTLGLLGIESPTENAFTNEDKRVLRSLASSAAMLLTNNGLFARAHGQEQQLNGLMSAMGTMLTDLDVSRMQQRLAVAARQALAADLAVVYRQASGVTESPAQDGALDPESLLGDVVAHASARKIMTDATGKPLFIENLTDDSLGLPSREQLRSMAVVPLVSDGVTVGVLYAAYRRPIRFGPAAKNFIQSFGEITARTLKNGVAHRSLADAVGKQMQSLSMASHELKEPVDTAKMIVETALNGLWEPVGDQLRERLGEVYSLLDNHYTVLTQILQLGKLNSGMQKLVQEPLQIGDLLSEVVGTFLNVASGKGVNLSANLDTAINAVQALGDSGLLKTAISNLVQNGIKFTAEGGQVMVTAMIDKQTNPTGDLVILVDDNGIGIPADKLESIFTPYFQVDQSLSRTQSGIGLGLSLARSIIEQHGGTLTVESQEGQGSRFTIRLPLSGPIADQLANIGV